MLIQRAYKTKLRPTMQQRRYFGGCCGAARFVYNWALADRKAVYEAGGKPNKFEQKRRFNAAKDEICPWIREYPYALLEAEFDHVDAAYQHFFRRIKQGRGGKEAGFPRFKKRGLKSSFVLRGSIHIEDCRVRLPRIGWVVLAERSYIPADSKINAVTVSERAGDWYISVQVEEEVPDPQPGINGILGIDVGIKSLAVFSDGRAFDNPKTLYGHEKKLARLGRELSRRSKGGSNWKKTKAKMARLHRKVADTRQHALHDISQAAVKVSPEAIAIEDLNIKGMMSNGHLAKALADSSISELLRQVSYKAEWTGAELLTIDRWYASSKTCSGCGCVKDDLTLADRVYQCAHCGLEIDRDLNAARNIAAYGERLKRAGLPVELGGLPPTMKQEGGS